MRDGCKSRDFGDAVAMKRRVLDDTRASLPCPHRFATTRRRDDDDDDARATDPPRDPIPYINTLFVSHI